MFRQQEWFVFLFRPFHEHLSLFCMLRSVALSGSGLEESQLEVSVFAPPSPAFVLTGLLCNLLFILWTKEVILIKHWAGALQFGEFTKRRREEEATEAESPDVVVVVVVAAGRRRLSSPDLCPSAVIRPLAPHNASHLQSGCLSLKWELVVCRDYSDDLLK